MRKCDENHFVLVTTEKRVSQRRGGSGGLQGAPRDRAVSDSATATVRRTGQRLPYDIIIVHTEERRATARGLHAGHARPRDDRETKITIALK